MTALDLNRRPYLSKRVRAGLREIISRVSPETDTELIALRWIRRSVDLATIEAPESQDAMSRRRPEEETPPAICEETKETQ